MQVNILFCLTFGVHIRKAEIPVIHETEITVPQHIIAQLELFRSNIIPWENDSDNSVEFKCYHEIAEFFRALKPVLFNCANINDRKLIISQFIDDEIDDEENDSQIYIFKNNQAKENTIAKYILPNKQHRAFELLNDFDFYYADEYIEIIDKLEQILCIE